MFVRSCTAVIISCGLAIGMTPCAGATADHAGIDRTCIQAAMIDHTDIVDNNTILFHMKDRTVWRNSLQAVCPTLNSGTGGFVFATNFPEVCANAQMIRILNSGVTCRLGDFTQEPPAVAR